MHETTQLCLSVFCTAVFFLFSSKYRYSYRCDNFQIGLLKKSEMMQDGTFIVAIYALFVGFTLKCMHYFIGEEKLLSKNR